MEAELPGFSRDEVDVRYENGILTIEAQRGHQPSEAQRENYHLRERRFARVQRSFTLPTSVDIHQVDARLKEGVLWLKLPKSQEVRPQRIELK